MNRDETATHPCTLAALRLVSELVVISWMGIILVSVSFALGSRVSSRSSQVPVLPFARMLGFGHAADARDLRDGHDDGYGIDEATAFRLISALEDGRLDHLFEAPTSTTQSATACRRWLTLDCARRSHPAAGVNPACAGTDDSGWRMGDYSGWITLSAEMVELLHWVDIHSSFDFSSAVELPDDEIRHLRNQILSKRSCHSG